MQVEGLRPLGVLDRNEDTALTPPPALPGVLFYIILPTLITAGEREWSPRATGNSNSYIPMRQLA